MKMFSKAFTYLPLLVTSVTALCKPLPPGESVGGTTNVTIESSGINRTYLISIPPNFDCENLTSVIFSFHGANRNASQQQELSQFSNPEFNNDSIAIYPMGINETWEGVPDSHANDTQFVTDILDQLEDQFSIDTKRIWASGKSDGGGFTNTLACDPTLSTRIAAFAPVSGAFYVDVFPDCNTSSVLIPCMPGRAEIPIIEFHGFKDTTIPYFGSDTRMNACLPTIPHWTQAWAVRDGLAATNITSNLTSDTLVYTFGTGNETGLVTQVTDFNLAHDWPSTVPVGDPETASFNATPIIIDFFRNHTLP